MSSTPPVHVDICGSCKHYLGIKLFTYSADSEPAFEHFCPAFPEGIPDEILLGDNHHVIPLKEQAGVLTFLRAI